MKRLLSLVCLFAVVVSISGCAKKTATEQLRDDMNKAASDVNKESKKLF